MIRLYVVGSLKPLLVRRRWMPYVSFASEMRDVQSPPTRVNADAICSSWTIYVLGTRGTHAFVCFRRRSLDGLVCQVILLPFFLVNHCHALFDASTVV